VVSTLWFFFLGNSGGQKTDAERLPSALKFKTYNMKRAYDDILKLLGEPLWYDDVGVPRYVVFHPRECGKHAYAIALSKGMCNECQKTFLVSSVKYRNDLRDAARTLSSQVTRIEELLHTPKGVIFPDALQEALLVRDDDYPILQRPQIGSVGDFHYGEPPWHDCVGDELIPLEVIQYWERGEYVLEKTSKLVQSSSLAGTMGWERLLPYEVDVAPAWMQRDT
jgi:hypothetical protein